MSRVTKADVIKVYLAQRRKKHLDKAAGMREQYPDSKWTEAMAAGEELLALEVEEIHAAVGRYLAGDMSALL